MINENMGQLKLLRRLAMMPLGLIAICLATSVVRAEDDFYSEKAKLELQYASDGWEGASKKEKEMLTWVVNRKLTFFGKKIEVTETFFPYLVLHDKNQPNKVAKLIGYSHTVAENYVKNDNDQWKKEPPSEETDFNEFPDLKNGLVLTPTKNYALAELFNNQCLMLKKGFKKKYGDPSKMYCTVDQYASDSNGDLKPDNGLSDNALYDALKQIGCYTVIDEETGDTFDNCQKGIE